MRFLLTILGLIGASTVWAADWHQFLGPNRDGRIEKVGIADTWPDKGPKEMWSVTVGPGYCAPSVRNGKVYILDRVDDLQDVMRCIDLASGKEEWRFTEEKPGRLPFEGSRAAPTVTDTHLFAVSGFGKVYCFDLKTQKPVWTRNFLDEYAAEVPRWGFSQSPLLVDGKVVVAPMSAKANLIALDPKTGETVWESTPHDGRSYASPMAYKLDGVDQILQLTSAKLSSIDPKSGKTLWDYDGYDCRLPIPNATQIDKNRIFLTAGYKSGSVMLQVNKKGSDWTIKEQFRIDQRGAQVHHAILYKNHLYANFNTNENLRGGNDEGLICIDMDGNTKWQTGAEPAMNRGSLIIVDGKILALGGESGVLHMAKASPSGFKPLASAQVFEEIAARDNRMWAPLAIQGTKLLVRSQSELKCLDLGKI